MDPSLAAYALYIAARNGDAELYDKLVALRQTSNDSSVKSNAQFLTAHFTGRPLVTLTLDSLLSEKSGINSRATMLAILLRNRDTQEQTWAYIQQHWDQVETIAGQRLVAAAGTFCSPESHEQALNFFNTHKVGGADRALKMAGESILACVSLRLAQEPGLKKWLAINDTGATRTR